MSNSTAARLQVEAEPVARIGDLVTTPAHAHPRGKAQRDAQSVLRKRRIKFIKSVMATGAWGWAETERCAETWYPDMDDRHRRAKVRELAAMAWEELSPAFDKREVAARILGRTETIARENLHKAPLIAMKADELTAKIVGLGEGPAAMASHTTNQTNVQVIQVGAAATHAVTTPAMQALVRGRAPRLVEATEVAATEP